VFFYDSSGSFTMTGGEISDNGSANSALPNSGIYLNGRVVSANISHNIVLDGAVAIKNNKVSLAGATSTIPKIYLGKNFATDTPIEFVLSISSTTHSNLQSYWNGKQLLASLPEDGLTIDAAAVGNFALAGHYYMMIPTGSNGAGCQQIAGYTSAITNGTEEEGPGAGYVVVTADTQ
jgi:hypothetical protein